MEISEMTNDTKDSRPVGMFFHSLKDGEVHWQGTVLSSPEQGWYLVQLFEWFSGSPNVCRLVRFEDMQDWLFYPDCEAMKFSYEYGAAREGGPYNKKED
jgi:hypothetical protein